MSRKSLLLLSVFLFGALFSTIQSATPPQQKIKHVVLLMLENRSFDHLLGFLKRNNSAIDGLIGIESCPVNATDPSYGYVTVSDNATYSLTWDPSHNHPSTDEQQFGYGPVVDPAPMTGFIENGNGVAGKGSEIMQEFNPTSLPTINTLGNDFAVIDQWFSSVPGPTQTNRMFLHAATSSGYSDNPSDKRWVEGFLAPSIYANMRKNGYDWRCYFGDVPSIVLMDDTRPTSPEELKNHFRPVEMFEKDAAAGNLPELTWIEPRWTELFYNFPSDDQHPPHDMKLGEYLIAHVYKKLRASPLWNSSVFVVMYDEHGGFWDHVSPPQQGVPSPDGKSKEGFEFDRLGVRTPLVVASPWINPQTVVHDAPPSNKPTNTSKFDHSSISATLKNLFGLENYLTERDSWANSFDFMFNARDTPRTDCPLELPTPERRFLSFEEYEKFLSEGPTEENLKIGELRGYKSMDPVTNLQKEMIISVCGALAQSKKEQELCILEVNELKTEHEAALYSQKIQERFMGQFEK